MILRQFGRMIVIVTAAFTLGVSIAEAKSSKAKVAAKSSAKSSGNSSPKSSERYSAAEKKFQRDLESLLGAPIKTAHGEMSLRQSKDRYGRVRKQILVGRDFSEIQLDQNGDGSVDYWSVKQGKKAAVASEPSRGRFLRLELSEQFDRGLQTSTYILSKNGRNYLLLKTRLIGRDVKFAANAAGGEDAPSFEAIDKDLREKDESARVQLLLDSGGSQTALPSAIVPSVEDSRFSLVEQQWAQQQTEVFGDGLTCAATDSGVGRLAQLQRQWWSVLKFEVDEKADRLTEKLKTSNLFDDSCKDDAHKDEFEKITKALSTVMLSSAKGDSWDSTNSRGRFLRCLEQSNLGVTAAEMERGFLDAMNGQYNAYKLFTCDFRPGSATAAETFLGKKQVSIYMTATDEAKGNREWDDSTVNYQNTLFHELMHTTGITDENIVHAAQACCGDPSARRGAACTKLDTLVAKENRFKVLETYLSRGDVTALQTSLTATFGSEDAAKLYRGFLEGLDDYKKGSPPTGVYTDGLISGKEFAKCLTTKSDSVCRAEWTAAIRTYADVFFSRQCGIIASGGSASKCTTVSKEFKDQMATAFATAMITRVQPVAGAAPSTPGYCVPKIGATRRESKGLYSLFEIARAVLSTEARADDLTCGDQIEIPSGTRAPTTCATPTECSPVVTTTPDTSTVGNIADAPGGKPLDTIGSGTAAGVGGLTGRQNDSVGNGASGGNSTIGSSNGSNTGGASGRPTTSPLPVRRVDSVTDSQTFAEDRYRRATDFVGASTRQLEDVRNSILPRAEASDRTRSRVDGRLGLKDDFVAFRPAEAKSTTTAIDNPFAEKRSIASIADIGNLKQGSGSSVANSVSSGSSISVSGDSPASTAAPQAEKRATDGGSVGGSSGAVSGGAGSGAVGGRTTASVGGEGGKSDAPGASRPDALEGLFTQSYREIEPRLNQLNVVEGLISARISVQDVKGRKFGSNRPREHYVFDGYNKPLKKQRD